MILREKTLFFVFDLRIGFDVELSEQVFILNVSARKVKIMSSK